MEIKHLQYFVECVKCQSFSDAAEHLYTTQPNVSKIIKSLEDELQVNLFERHTRGIFLTKEGAEVYQYAVIICENVEKLQNMCKK